MSNQIKERPILFSGAMINAILRGDKTQTRRVAKPSLSANFDPPRSRADVEAGYPFVETEHGDHVSAVKLCPYGQPGDQLWVRETWRHRYCIQHQEGQPPSRERPCCCGEFEYRAAGSSDGKWRPSIFMPRTASRITLEIVSVRIERLQDISEADAIAEGVMLPPCSYMVNCNSTRCPHHKENAYRHAFTDLWDTINGKRGYGWESNPFVWRVEFKRL